MKYAFSINGGLGDALLAYLMPGRPAGRIAALRARDPEAFVRVALMSTSSAAAGLFAECSLVDQMVFREWDCNFGAFERENARGFAAIPTDLPWSRPELALSAAERGRAAAIESKPFVALHPFAGTPDRDWRSNAPLAAIVAALVSKGVHVVILGGSSMRSDEDGSRHLNEQHEAWGDRVTSLVGRASVRLQAHLAMRTSCFVGSFSAYHCAALAACRPAFVLAGAQMKPFFERPHPVYGTLAARPGARFGFFEESPDDLVDRMAGFAISHVERQGAMA